MKEQVNKLQEELVDLQNVNKEMACYVEILERETKKKGLHPNQQITMCLVVLQTFWTMLK